MVYLGPSRGCETCKRRRKKCDETRPSCRRCLMARRACGGYEDGATRVFRQFQARDGRTRPFVSMARKCSLPARNLAPGSNIMPEDGCPKEMSIEKTEEFALRAFFYDYCIIPVNRSLCRGYLSGLEAQVRHLGLHSELAKACKVVAFANHGVKLNRPSFMRKAEKMYHDLLGYLAKVIEIPSLANIDESLTIATLLGLYEMINANNERSDYCNAHAGGVAAILRIQNSPLELLRFDRSGLRLGIDREVQTHGLFSSPYTEIKAESLDDLLISFGLILKNVDAVLLDSPKNKDGLCQIRDEVMILDRRFAMWQGGQTSDFMPKNVGHVSQGQFDSTVSVGYWRGKIDTYLDLSIAGVWNTYRTARLVLLNIIAEVSSFTEEKPDLSQQQQEALKVVEGIFASIPYQLTDDLPLYLSDIGKDTELTSPGRLVGGLLLMYPLHIASNLSIVPSPMQEYARSCLEWIGVHMGNGQASLLAKEPRIDKKRLAEGCMIVWAGLLL